MLLRLLAGIFGRKRAAATATGRGATVTRDGVSRPAVRLGVADPSIDLSNVAVESHPELRSAALLHTHYLPRVSAAALYGLHPPHAGCIASRMRIRSAGCGWVMSRRTSRRTR